jgi:branched-subunit amino acid transport protein AzlD
MVKILIRILSFILILFFILILSFILFSLTHEGTSTAGQRLLHILSFILFSLLPWHAWQDEGSSASSHSFSSLFHQRMATRAV